MKNKKRVLFRRRYKKFQGGHLKFQDYIDHFISFGYQCDLFLEKESIEDENINWSAYNRVDSYQPEKYDLLFLEGLDWQKLIPQKPVVQKIPKINLIQHPRHAVPGTKRHSYLKEKAIRICVSKYVEKSILDTGLVNGPVFTIGNGIRAEEIEFESPKSIDLLIVGINNKKTARKVFRLLSLKHTFSNLKFKLINKELPRGIFLETLEQSKIVLLFPENEEGFYLPALEGMAKGCLVICPDCGGNRDFCIDGENCLITDMSSKGMMKIIRRSVQMNIEERRKIVSNGVQTAREHSIKDERRQFKKIIDQIDELYK